MDNAAAPRSCEHCDRLADLDIELSSVLERINEVDTEHATRVGLERLGLLRRIRELPLDEGHQLRATEGLAFSRRERECLVHRIERQTARMTQMSNWARDRPEASRWLMDINIADYAENAVEAAAVTERLAQRLSAGVMENFWSIEESSSESSTDTDAPPLSPPGLLGSLVLPKVPSLSTSPEPASPRSPMGIRVPSPSILAGTPTTSTTSYPSTNSTDLYPSPPRSPVATSLTLGGALLEPAPKSVVDMRSLEYVDAANPNLVCGICLNPFVDPVLLAECGHVFCRECSAMWERNEPWRCATCRQYPGVTVAAPPFVRRMVDELVVRCPLRERGCAETMPREQVEAHVTRYCAHRDVPQNEDEVSRPGSSGHGDSPDTAPAEAASSLIVEAESSGPETPDSLD